jgi:hypothetical protein
MFYNYIFVIEGKLWPFLNNFMLGEKMPLKHGLLSVYENISCKWDRIFG